LFLWFAWYIEHYKFNAKKKNSRYHYCTLQLSNVIKKTLYYLFAHEPRTFLPKEQETSQIIVISCPLLHASYSHCILGFWIVRNNETLKERRPNVIGWKEKFIHELALVCHRIQNKYSQHLEVRRKHNLILIFSYEFELEYHFINLQPIVEISLMVFRKERKLTHNQNSKNKY
jgi:hypothetical protein